MYKGEINKINRIGDEGEFGGTPAAIGTEGAAALSIKRVVVRPDK